MEVMVLLALLHFLPTVIALLRGHHNSFAIFLTNLLLGWTVIGWIIALIWSFTAVARPVRA
ncbi:superinfection immunity protein [Oceanicaulis sp. MMSF_3324]|uniref:superinfection immunity protein n=1 Tax=Oceanicaulis sp. MMSF_3324 TaxID=3046702 RepID=UPI00273DF05B|nr:superinfection immunity protein [Oceanicaulis sp. MMSF_3324]